MDPATIIVAALVAGASAAGEAAIGEGVKDAYRKLKHLVLRRVGDQDPARDACEAIDAGRGSVEPATTAALTDAIRAVEPVAQQELLETAQDLDRWTGRDRPGRTTTVYAPGAQGVTIGDGNVVHQRFDRRT